MSELTKGFEKEFPLPWGVEFRDTAAFIRPVDMPEQYSIFLDTNIPDHIGAVRYAVQCANLMPEAVELLGKCAIEMQKRCDYCAGKGGRACIGCSNSEMRTEIHALLAKLEGGTEDEDD